MNLMNDESEWKDEHGNVVEAQQKTMKLASKDKYVKCNFNRFAY